MLTKVAGNDLCVGHVKASVVIRVQMRVHRCTAELAPYPQSSPTDSRQDTVCVIYDAVPSQVQGRIRDRCWGPGWRRPARRSGIEWSARTDCYSDRGLGTADAYLRSSRIHELGPSDTQLERACSMRDKSQVGQTNPTVAS